ncbi:hypothetical protein IQ06DRAFT_347870 [Phaeosphaeriaceae sp. SRC1lsM3a]|nr:hypothetical protein IQ06DRAFT_347870 [Stagonospora sp. SRC1lsM3a]
MRFINTIVALAALVSVTTAGEKKGPCNNTPSYQCGWNGAKRCAASPANLHNLEECKDNCWHFVEHCKFKYDGKGTCVDEPEAHCEKE